VPMAAGIRLVSVEDLRDVLLRDSARSLLRPSSLFARPTLLTRLPVCRQEYPLKVDVIALGKNRQTSRNSVRLPWHLRMTHGSQVNSHIGTSHSKFTG